MATGELSNSETARLEVRKALVEGDYVDCIMQLTGQLFANTQIPCGLWFLSKSRGGGGGFRKRKGEILFIDGRKLGTLIPGSRKQKQLADEEIEKVAAVYRAFRRGSASPGSAAVPAASAVNAGGTPALLLEEVRGFCKVATLDEVREHKYALTPGRYVGAPDGLEDDEPFEEKLPQLTALLRTQIQESQKLDRAIEHILEEVGNGG
jgi:type I restriction enzyme M protein